MTEDLHTLTRAAHIALGSAGFLLGALATLLPKFGRRARPHRLVGRLYGVSMLSMGVLSIPLALRQGDLFLLVIGVLTLGWVAVGWGAIRRVRRAATPAGRERLLGLHINTMGSSYIAAWTAFLVNVEPLGAGSGLFWLYALGPSLVGSVLIARGIRRQARLSVKPLPSPVP